mgnify:CR=1 FL=1
MHCLRRMNEMVRKAFSVVSVLLLVISPYALSESNCALTGSSSVQVEGRGMLKLGDVQGCTDVQYEIIPNLIIEGQPAVRLLPRGGIDCRVSGSAGVVADGGQVARVGDVVCPKP